MPVLVSRLAEKLSDLNKNQDTKKNVVFWFDGDSSEANFALPKGWEPLKVYSDGALMRDGSSEDYTVTFNGFIYTVVFAVAPAAVNVGIDATRAV